VTSQANVELIKWATGWFTPRKGAKTWLRPGKNFKKNFKKQFSSLERAGYATSTSSRTTTQTIVGLSMMGVGYYLRQSKGRTVLYRHTARPGESVRIKVIQGTRTLADTTVET
jgi:hypothetical protein